MSESALALKFRNLTREGQALGLELERGQATSPLAEHFAALGEQQARAPFELAVVAFSPTARNDAVAWLLGEQHRGVSMRTSSLPGLVEIRLSEQGYALETRQGERLEFDNLQGFLGALGSSADGLWPQDGHALHSLKLSLAAPGASGSVLLLPESLAASARSPGLANALLTRSQLLVLAAEAGQAITADELERAAHLAQGIGCVLPVSTGVDMPHAVFAWWRAVMPGSDGLLLAPALLGASMPPAPLSGAALELRPGLVLVAQLRRLQLAIEALHERHDQDLRLCQTRRSREERSTRPELPPDAGMRRPYDQAKVRAQEEMAALAKAPAENSRRGLLPDGAVSRALSEQLDSLCGNDLVQEPGAKTVRISLSTEFLAHLQRAIRRALKEELGRDLVTLRDGLHALKRDLETTLEAAVQAPVSLGLSPPSESDVWARAGELVSVDIRYRGEMPRRGFLQRLGEGRRAVFAVMMILSLVGSMVGFSWRGLGVLGLAFLAMFVGVVVFTYRSWKREDAEKLDTELDRVREQLLNECRRIATEVQREKQSRLADQLDQSKRALLSRLDDMARERAQREQELLNEQRERARGRLRKLDTQLRELQALSQRIAKLRSDGAALLPEAARHLRESAQRLKLAA